MRFVKFAMYATHILFGFFDVELLMCCGDVWVKMTLTAGGDYVGTRNHGMRIMCRSDIVRAMAIFTVDYILHDIRSDIVRAMAIFTVDYILFAFRSALGMYALC